MDGQTRGSASTSCSTSCSASCVPVSLSVLVLALERVQAGFEAQGVDVGQVGGAVQVQARQDLHVSDPGRVELQQLLHPL